MISVHDRVRLDTLSQGARLSGVAKAQIHDANAAYLTVHGVLARAMDKAAVVVTTRVLDLALSRSVASHLAAHLSARILGVSDIALSETVPI